MARRLALIFLGVAALLILLFSLVGGGAAAGGLALLGGAFPFALIVLGASRGGRLGAAALPVFLLLVVIELALLGMLLLRGRVVDGPWFGGLPLAAALLVYGVFLLPLVVTALGFALDFRNFTVGERDLERLRDLAAGREAFPEPPE